MNAKKHSAQIWSHALNEMPPNEQADFENACQTHPELQTEAKQAKRVIALLNDLPNADLSHDLTPEIMDRISSFQRAPAPLFFPGWRFALNVAAGLALCLSGVWLARNNITEPHSAQALCAPQVDRAVDRALDWLVTAQESSGTWQGDHWEGQQAFSISLTSLALMALTQSPKATCDPAYTAAIGKATVYLVKQAKLMPDPNTATFRSRYDQALLTGALLEAYRIESTPELHRTLDRALAQMLRQQATPQVWQYARTDEGPENQPDFLWACLALQKAVALDWPQLRGQTDALLALARQRITPSHLNDLACHVIPDVNRDRLCTTCSLPAQQRLLALQEQVGLLAGSWPAQNGPQAAGGRVYSTAMNTLMLRPQG